MNEKNPEDELWCSYATVNRKDSGELMKSGELMESTLFRYTNGKGPKVEWK
jgi:hypothetical protein